MTITPLEEHLTTSSGATLLGHFEHGSPEWHNARRGIGGSDIGTILGVNPWKSAYTLWAEKTSRLDPSFTPSDAMTLGTIFEAPIRNLWAERNKAWLTVHETGTWQSGENPLWTANPDGIIQWHNGQLGILEIKYTSQRWTELPPSYEAQVRWYMDILGLEVGILVAVSGGQITEYRIDADLEKSAQAEAAAYNFEQLLLSDQAPDWDGSASTYETVRELSDGLEEGEAELRDLWEHLANA